MPVLPGDIIELAGSGDYQFSVETAPVEVTRPEQPVEGRTERLIASARASLQILRGGVAVDVVEVDERGVSIGGGTASPSASRGCLSIDGLEPAPYATITLQKSDASLGSEDRSIHRNLEPVAARSVVPLHDKDLITFPDAPDVSVLFLDPRRVHERNLSDLFADADRITVGTGAASSCRIIDPSLSRAHAEIWREGGEIFVKISARATAPRSTDDGCSTSSESRGAAGITLGRLRLSPTRRAGNRPWPARRPST